MGLSYVKVYEIAKEYNLKLLASDIRLRGSVKIIHEEGSVLDFEYAFLMKLDNWIMVFTEHHGFHVYSKDDLVRYAQYTRIYEIEELK